MNWQGEVIHTRRQLSIKKILTQNCPTNQVKIVQEILMLIIILSLSKTKEFVKEILYELFSPKGAYSTVEGTKYCRNCSHNSIQFASRTMVFVETCQNLRRILRQDLIERFVQSARFPLPVTFLLVLRKRCVQTHHMQ